MHFEIRHSDEPLPDEEDIYGVNEIDEYDPVYRLMSAYRARRREVMIRVVAAILVAAFAALAGYLRGW